MTAAAKCPKCSHLLDLRDGFGELLPLAYCSSCDSYYPEQLGECKWCHTKPERPPIGPKIWRGIGAGLAGAFGVTRLMSGLLFRISPTDPSTFAVITLLLVLVSLLACYLPARRATRVDPILALRGE